MYALPNSSSRWLSDASSDGELERRIIYMYNTIDVIIMGEVLSFLWLLSVDFREPRSSVVKEELACILTNRVFVAAT